MSDADLPKREVPDGEIEVRLSGLPLDGPRAGLREDVLEAVRAELPASAESLPRLDRWLSRPAPWIAAAALLVGLLVGDAALEDRYEPLAPRESASTQTPASAADGALAFARNRALILQLVSGEANGV